MDQATKENRSAPLSRSARRPSGLRNHNERVVLGWLRAHGELPSGEIARQTGLSAQASSVILRSLEGDGLVERGDPVRGKVGKPFVPYRLGAEGAYSIGLRIGRRTADLVLMDFTGAVLDQISSSFRWPEPDALCAFCKDGIARFERGLGRRSGRIIGIGVGAPFELWNWLDSVGAPKERMLQWKGFKFETAFRQFTDLPVHVANDATIACYGEWAFGGRAEGIDFAYLYVGSFIGGGIVLNGEVQTGHTGNAGAFGPLPIPQPDGSVRPLLETASLFVLEAGLEAGGMTLDEIYDDPMDWSGHEATVTDWIDATAHDLSLAAVMVASILDVPKIVVDGRLPDDVRRALVDKIAALLAAEEIAGVSLPVIAEGRLGRVAGALGAAFLPLAIEYEPVGGA